MEKWILSSVFSAAIEMTYGFSSLIYYLPKSFSRVSLWSHGLWPTRILCPWNSPGKNTGAGCHIVSNITFPFCINLIFSGCRILITHYWIQFLSLFRIYTAIFINEFEQTLGISDGQGSLACCSPWGHKESDTTEWQNWTELNWFINELSLWLSFLICLWLVY